jgi:hypothetical protein
MRIEHVSRNCHYFVLKFLSLLMIFFLVHPLPVEAQSSGSAAITPPSTNAFPIFSTSLVAYDSQGNFIHNLNPTQVQLFEDGEPLTILKLEEQRPGASIAIVLNPGPPFAIQNSQGVSRYDFIVEALAGWGMSRVGTNIDDLSLLTTGGASTNHVTNPADLVTVLNSGQVEARTAAPNLDTLFEAENLVADAGSRPSMGRAILFVTPPLEGVVNETIDNAISQAQQNNIRINVWMVSSPGAFSGQAADQLAQLAEGTGGSYFMYTGEEELPDPEIYFEPLRSNYLLEYESKLTTSGTHQLQAQVETNAEPVSTLPQLFEFEILAPIPTLISPPLVITRAPLNAENNSYKDEDVPPALFPQEQVISTVIDFPDGRTRGLKRSALFVDGKLAVENTAPPYDKFIWNIDNYNENGSFLLQVELEDIFGMKGQSAEIPVEIRLELPEPSPLSTIRKNIPIISVLAVILGGSILFLILILAGRLKPKLPGRTIRWRRGKDPLAQPAANSEVPSRIKRSSWAGASVTENTIALLIPISEHSAEARLSTIPLEKDDITFGRDPNLADIYFDDPALEAVHARLVYDPNGQYRLIDEGTVAGTWINYTPVSRDGSSLENGDWIHIGRIGFRYAINKPDQDPEPHIEYRPDRLKNGLYSHSRNRD